MGSRRSCPVEGVSGMETRLDGDGRRWEEVVDVP